MMIRNPWPHAYQARHGYVWGTAPTALAREVARLRSPRRSDSSGHCRLLDVGCGEGRDVVFFARLGYEAVGLDCSRAAIGKARRMAQASGVRLRRTPRWIVAEASRYRPPLAVPYDIVFSCGVLHYLPRRLRPAVFGRLKAVTRPDGLHAVLVFTDLQPHRELDEQIEAFTDGELWTLYEDWRIRQYREEQIACEVDGTAHEHSVAVVLAEPPWRN